MKESDYDRLLKRYLENKTTPQETAKINAWLDANKAEDGEEAELSKQQEDLLFQKITAKIDNIDEVLAIRPVRSPLQIFLSNRWLQAAAAIVIVAFVSLLAYTNYSPDADFIADSKWIGDNGIKKTILNDGTIVWLTKGSTLSYYQKENENIRHATLHGEGLFEVAKMADKPFIIACGDFNVRVLGTSFSLKASNDQLELKVLTGKVNLSSSKDNKGIDVIHDEKVVYELSGKNERSVLPSAERSTMISHTEYNMDFEGAYMDKIIERIEKKFDVYITSTEAINTCQLTSDFTDHSLESTLAMISEITGIHYTVEGKYVTLTGKGCK